MMYLDRCSTIAAFAKKKYLRNVETLEVVTRVKVNTGEMRNNKQGRYGNLKVCYLPKEIANIFFMNELEQSYCIIYDSCGGYHVVHNKHLPVHFQKGEKGLIYIDLDKSGKTTAIMLV
jgi:hypothetical protein